MLGRGSVSSVIREQLSRHSMFARRSMYIALAFPSTSVSSRSNVKLEKQGLQALELHDFARREKPLKHQAAWQDSFSGADAVLWPDGLSGGVTERTERIRS